MNELKPGEYVGADGLRRRAHLHYSVEHGEDWDGCGCGVGDLMPCGGPRTNCQPARRVTWDTCSWRDEDGCPEGCTTETCQGCYEMGRGKIGPC